MHGSGPRAGRSGWLLIPEMGYIRSSVRGPGGRLADGGHLGGAPPNRKMAIDRLALAEASIPGMARSKAGAGIVSGPFPAANPG
jgi:hypothetical protein